MSDVAKNTPNITGDSFWVGTNFWSSSGGPLMWDNYDSELIRKELRQLTAMGCNVTRSFLYWPHFVPREHRLDMTAVERLGDFLDAHLEVGLMTIPTFLVGHMSGENWDPTWRNGRDLYRDVTMLGEEAWFVHEIAAHFKNHSAICGWLISNEMPLYGGKDASSQEIFAWAQSLVHAVRAAGANQPLSLGDGAWGLETTGVDNGFSLRTLKGLVDFIGPHTYPVQSDEIREFLYAAYMCQMASGFELPVILEEFGVTSDFVSEENAAIYYRHVLYSTLLAGAQGWLAWNNCDYDGLYQQDPYRHHPFELHFGLIDAEGRPKLQAGELASFASFIKTLPSKPSPLPRTVGIVVPEHFDTKLPFTENELKSDIAINLFQSYVSSKLADLNIDMVREKDGLSENYKLFISPSTKALTTDGLQSLLRVLENGSCIYLSYFGGSTDNQRGPWITWLDKLFGVSHKLRYGLVEPIESENIVFKFIENFGHLRSGQTLSFKLPKSMANIGYLPITADKAKIIAVDQNEMPALTLYTKGAGKAVLCTYPLEYFAANRPNDNPNDIAKIYQAAAEEAGVSAILHIDDLRIAVGTMEVDDRVIAIAANLTSDEINTPMVLDQNYAIAYLSGEDTPEKVFFASYQIHIFSLSKR
ncbi:MAG: cellulase family glycosylhydrolase [Firmicutes bacterium]|nr:cellulase family glycosylhydrolase [Bacillota bacterium]